MEDWSDSVTEMVWSRDGSMLAAADMAGNIKVWKYPGYKLCWSFELGQDVLWLQWHSQVMTLSYWLIITNTVLLLVRPACCWRGLGRVRCGCGGYPGVTAR